jgi:RNA polymerase sigma-70 factor (ECF subfamily)
MSLSSEKHDRFLTLLRQQQQALERYVLAMARDPEIAKDVVAETVMIAFERFETLKSPEAFLSFLLTIATRAYRRSQARSARVPRADEEAIEMMLDPGISPETATDIAAVHGALGRLPEKQREAVVLFEIIGLSMKEIQAIQGGTVVGVKVRISRGRRKLARYLGVEPIPLEETPAGGTQSRIDDASINEVHFLSIVEKP